jgi:hypothetical protein
MRGIIARSPGIRIILEFAPVHLKRAGVEPAYFADEITDMGLTYALIDSVSGETRALSKDELLTLTSANILLSESHKISAESQ